MKKKIISVVAFGVLMCSATIILMNHKPTDKRDVYEKLTFLGTEEEYGDSQNLALQEYAPTGGEYCDNIMEDMTNGVLISGLRVLADHNVDMYGINSLNEYMTRFLNYYLGESLYYMEIEEDSFDFTSNLPRFYAWVYAKDTPEQRYYIKCIYKPLQQRYLFLCNEITEKED